ncbi:MAG: diguanylate cyclase, partial [Candidatus Binatia bacterium]
AATETLRENLVAGLRVPPGRSIAGWVARTGESAIVDDVASDPRFYPEIDHISRFGTRNLLAVPLRKDGKVIGVVEIANRYEGRAFDDADRRQLEALGAELASTIDPESVAHDSQAMRSILAAAVTAVPGEAASLLLYDPEGHELVFHASRTLQAGLVDGIRLSCGQGIAGWVARHREAVRIDDVLADPRHYRGLEEQTHFVPRSMICVPMVSKDALRGVIQVINKIDGSSFDEEELHLTQRLADHAAIAIENASLYRQAYLASITDDLTGLGNTRHFNRMLRELLVRSLPLSLLVLDLDNFKRIVDTFGHLAGSRTIAHLGRLIGRLIRPGDVAARFGGDEFVILLPGTECRAAVEIGETIRAAIAAEERIDTGGVDIAEVTASVGAATAPDHARTADELFHAADAAMYEVKRRGKNAVGRPVGHPPAPGL